MPYTATQKKLIKTRARAYFYATKADARAYAKEAEEPYRFSWKDFATLIFDLTKEESKAQFKGDSLRAIVEGQISRGKRRMGGDESLDTLVKFLTHPEIKALNLEELDEPRIPHLFAMQLVEFLNFDAEDEVALPPSTLEGAYQALCRSERGI